MKTTLIAIVACILAPGVLFSVASPAGQLPAKSELALGNGVSLPLVLVPAGTFRMGSPIAEKEREADETPHQVTLTRAFYLGATHVTVDQFAAFVRDSGYTTDGERAGQSTDFSISDGRFQFLRDRSGSWRETSYEQTGRHPVVHVSWNDAKAFCAWLSRRTKRTAFLPTEAQWEYAARAGTTTAYPWGDNPNDGKGWINGADGSLKTRLLTDSRLADMEFFTWDDGFVFTSPAGSFRPNAFGVYDMTGNVWQWVEDLYGRMARHHPLILLVRSAAADAFCVVVHGCSTRATAGWPASATICPLTTGTVAPASESPSNPRADRQELS